MLRVMKRGVKQSAAWVIVVAVLVYWAWHMLFLGLDVKQDFWVYSTPNHSIGDVNSALEHGNMVLRDAETIEAQHPEGTGATIARPGPGLFDSPLTPQEFIERWHRLRPVYGLILRGWVQTYENLYRDMGPAGNYEMDYPPMRLLIMSLWTWKVQANFPGMIAVARVPQRFFDANRNQSVVATQDVVQPLLHFNAFCEGVTSICVFILVWLWMARKESKKTSVDISEDWRSRWGDPMLLAPVVIFGIWALLRPHLQWEMALGEEVGNSLIDQRTTSVGWWFFQVLRFLAVVCLARFLPRPFRAPMCAMVAATLAWINPATMLDDFAWPQWESWIPPFFLLAAVLISLDCWVAAGILLGIGSMFKGQLTFISPVLILCPLLAGWPGRFFKIFTGTIAGAGMIIWPWLVTNASAERWIFLTFSVGLFFCALSVTRGFIRRHVLASWRRFAIDLPASLGYTILASGAAFAAAVVCLVIFGFLRHGLPLAVVLLGVGIFVVPWVLPRRLFPAWILFSFAAPLWLVGFYDGGSHTWWDVGFLYGTQRHTVMQLGANSLSNLSSILHERYGWELHDIVGTLNLPFAGATPVDVQGFCAAIFGASLVLCAIGAAIQLRRNDSRFLIVLVTPWVLFSVLLTQMASRYTTLPAAVAPLLIGVSAEMSLLLLLQIVIAWIMLGGQMMAGNHDIAPWSFTIVSPTHPDMGWLMVLLAGLFLASALMPTIRWRRAVEVI